MGTPEVSTRFVRELRWCVALCFGLLLGCSSAAPTLTVPLLRGETMGTTYSVKLGAELDSNALAALAVEIDDELLRVNRQMSTYIPDSEISLFNASPTTDWFPVSEETAKVVETALQVYQSSHGAFDVTVGPLVNAWGFGPDKRPDRIPTSDEIQALLANVGSDKLDVRLQPPALKKSSPKMRVDLSAIAKGHGVDRVAAVLDRNGIESYFVEIGGEVRVKGTRPDGQYWRVGIEKPGQDLAELQHVVELKNQSMASSGNYRNFYELDGKRYWHTIDPKSGMPVVDAIASASAVSQTCELSDAIATCMMASGFEKGLFIAAQNDWAVLLVKYEEGKWVQAASPAFTYQFPEPLASEAR